MSDIQKHVESAFVRLNLNLFTELHEFENRIIETIRGMQIKDMNEGEIRIAVPKFKSQKIANFVLNTVREKLNGFKTSYFEKDGDDAVFVITQIVGHFAETLQSNANP